MIDIKDISGKIRFSTEINIGAKGAFTLMKEDYVTIPFSVDTPIYFKLGDYVDFAGILDDYLGSKLAKIYELVDLYQPVFNQSTGGYDYQLRLDAYYWKWKNKIFKYTPESGGREASWSLTASLASHLGIFIRNLDALGYNYRGNGFTFAIDSSVETSPRPITYDNTSLIDALSLMAEAWDCEWWVTDNIINFGRCEFGDAVRLEIGAEIESMSQSKSGGTYATRIYAFGSTRNIPSNYRPVDTSIVVNGIVQKRLMLPEGTPYIDAFPGMSEEEAIEAVVVFDDIYPRRIGTVSSVSTVEKTETVDNEDGTQTENKYTVYRYKDTGLAFSEEYILAGQELRISFQSGSMNGMEFGVTFNPDKKDPAEQLWEIVRNEDYGRMLPDDVLHPRNGDTYVLSGFDTKFVSDTMLPEAERELKERAELYASRMRIDDGTYPTTLMSDWVREDPINRTYGVGQRVSLINPAYFENGRVSRVLGFEFNLDIPYDSPVYTIGESAAYSRIGNLEDKVDSLTYKGETYAGGGGSGVYVIRTNDSTPASDSNVFSALRSLATFLRKDRPDQTNYLIKFLGGLVSDNIESQAFSAGPFGSGYVLKRNPKTGKSYMEIDEIYVRLKAYFETLEIKRLSHAGGRIVLSPAGMECIRVEEVSAEYEKVYDSAAEQVYDSLNDEVLAPVDGGERAWRCYFKQKDDEREIVNEFAVDDQAQCREFNVKAGVSHQVSNRYYWRRVLAVGEDYIDLSMTDCDGGSMEPKAGDTIVTVGNRTDPARSHVVFLSSYDDDAPSIKLYSGINSYSMLNKEVTVISPNADKNVFTGKMVIRPGSTGFGNLDDAPDMGEVNEAIQDAKDAATNANTAAGEVRESVANLKGYVDGAFADGIISEAEAKAIEKYLNVVSNERQSAESIFSKLYNNMYLEGSAKVALQNARASLLDATTALSNSITTAIADGRTTVAEKRDVDTKYAAFNTRCSDFREAVEAANESIQEKLKGYSDNAQKAADEANNAASNAIERANAARESVESLSGYVDGAFADGIISEAEAKAIEKYINTVSQTRKETDATYTSLYTNPYLTGTYKTALYNAKSGFNTATSNLTAAIEAAISDGKTTASEKQDVDTKFDSFNSAYATLASAIGNANKAIQDRIKEEATNAAKENASGQIETVSTAAKEDIAKQLGYGSYADLEAAAKRGESVIDGGSINTRLINADLIVTSALIASAIRTNTLNVNEKFIVNRDGSVSMSGAITTEEGRRRSILSDGFLHIMTHSEGTTRFSEILRIVANESYDPEIFMQASYHGVRNLSITPYGLTFDYIDTLVGDRQTLTIDPVILGQGMKNAVIKKTSDGMLYVAEDTAVKYKLIINVSGEGTTSPAPGVRYVTSGKNVSLRAFPAEGHEFSHWSDGGAQDHTIAVTMDGYSVTAYFVKKTTSLYTVTLKASPANGGTVNGGGAYESGTRRNISASANTGYRFVRWSDGGSQTHTVTWDSNKTITAYFEKYTVTGNELFSGTALTSKSYWQSYGNSSVSSVSGGVATVKCSGDVSGDDYVIFNKGYLGSKMEKGHKYRITMQVKSSVSDTTLIGAIGGNLEGDNVGIFFYGEALGDAKIGTSYKTITSEVTAERDSATGDGFIIVAVPACALSIRSISLKEV